MSQRLVPLARHATVAALFASACLAALPAHALYKVVGPDGKITYTDRPPVARESRVESVNTSTGGPSTSGLPYELRQTVQRFPVTLYASAACGPCDQARQALRQRGVPFSERTIATNDDRAALQRITGKTDLPAVTIGGQVIVGHSDTELTGYLDAAGYPKRSALPANYTEPAASPLVAPAPAPAAAAEGGSPAPAASPAPGAAPAGAGGIRF